MYWYAPHGLEVLFSPQHGFFFWTPLAVLALAGLVVLAIRPDGDGRSSVFDGRRIAVCLIVMVASQVYVAGSVASWTVAGAFGQRRFICLTSVLVIGLAALLRHRNMTQKLMLAIMVVCVWWNVALMAQFATGLMDRQRLEPGRNAYHAFVTLPRDVPSLVYRYLTNRESFYRPSRP
jgi:hypothetical protein